MIEVRFQRGLHLPELDLWLDPWDTKPWAFVSHAHADHFARHEKALCSTVTGALVRSRNGVAESRLDAVAFRAGGQPVGEMLLGAGGLPLHVAGHLRRDTWGGREKIELMIEDVADPRRQG